MKRSWLVSSLALFLTTGGLVAACGSSGDESIFNPGGNVLDGSTSGDLPDGPVLSGQDGSTSTEGGSSGCVRKTCQDLGATCGPQGDGCGNQIDCGSCIAPETCGGGGVPSQCGGNSGCVPKTCTDLGVNCGAQGDGCGGSIPSCGTCTAPEICGGGTAPSTCGAGLGDVDAGTCTPTKVTCAPGECGPIADGCGGVLNCGGCTAPEICGGGGQSLCGGGFLPDGGLVCTPKTCASFGANCGPVGDGCGGLIPSCGNCATGTFCGGGGPGKCGGSTADAGACTGLCAQQVKCDGGITTTLTGVVVSPRDCQGATCNSKLHNGDADPIYNANVFIPNGGDAAIQPFGTTLTCDQCGGAGVQGGVLVSAITGADGKFSLANVPVGNNIPIVVQLGRWRRVFHVNVTNTCASTPIGDLHLPKNHTQGDIPLMAMSTGEVDTLECLLRKMGIDDAEFSNPSGTGRVRLYRGNGGEYDTNTPSDSTLYTSPTELAKHDITLFPCWGEEDRRSTANKTNLINYTHAGGRVFTTHYSYVWLFGAVPGTNTLAPNEFSATANWHNAGLADPNQDHNPRNPATSTIDTTFTKGLAFSQWLNNVTTLSSTNPPQIAITDPRGNVDTVVGGTTSQQWISTTDFANGTEAPHNAVEHYTFNTPVGGASASQCGRVVFSDFHVTGGSGTFCTVPAGTSFPQSCCNSPNATNCGPGKNQVCCDQGAPTTHIPFDFPQMCGGTVANNHNKNQALTAQEKVLEFMLFDIASCIQPDNPTSTPSCTKLTCAQQNIHCGPAGDGCGGLIPSCGNCTGNTTCGGGGTPNQCGGPACQPKTCAQLGFTCGLAGDGCGGLLSCGTCAAGKNCGGGGQQNVCGTPTCTPKTCQELGVQCGPTGDGCGNLVDCGTCTAPDTCGGGGTAGQCGHTTCTPTTCAAAGATCGPLADGCGGLLQCGDCVSPQSCGGAGVSNQCGGNITH